MHGQVHPADGHDWASRDDNDGNEIDQTGLRRDTVRGDIEQLVGGQGGDVIFGDASNETLNGGPGPDRIFGQNGADAIDGSFGDDYLSGSNGGDTILGGPDQDQLLGGGDSDSLAGGNGNDSLIGKKGFDALNGKRGLRPHLRQGRRARQEDQLRVGAAIAPSSTRSSTRGRRAADSLIRRPMPPVRSRGRACARRRGPARESSAARGGIAGSGPTPGSRSGAWRSIAASRPWARRPRSGAPRPRRSPPTRGAACDRPRPTRCPISWRAMK